MIFSYRHCTSQFWCSHMYSIISCSQHVDFRNARKLLCLVWWRLWLLCHFGGLGVLRLGLMDLLMSIGGWDGARCVFFFAFFLRSFLRFFFHGSGSRFELRDADCGLWFFSRGIFMNRVGRSFVWFLWRECGGLFEQGAGLDTPCWSVVQVTRSRYPR